MTDLGHLKRLSTVRSNAGVKLLTPCAFPGSHCPLHPALALAGKIQGISSLVIGMPECATYSQVVLPPPQRRHGDLHWTYVLDAHEVVFGCRKGLLDALHEMDRAGAKVILLLGTCVPDLIGEDIEGIVRETQSKLSARLAVVMMGHFKNNSLSSGSWKTLKALGSLMESRAIRPRVINAMGHSADEKHAPMPPFLRALQDRGFTLRCLAPDSSLEEFMEAPAAVLNLVLSPFTEPLATDMEQRFGTPAFRLHSAYDPAKIDAIYAAIAEQLGIRWGNEFDCERMKSLSLQEEAKSRLSGCRYICAHTGPGSTLPLAAYLSSIGMKPLLLHLEEFWPDDKIWAQAINAQGCDPYVCHMVNSHSDVPLLESLAPDLFLGQLPDAKIPISRVPFLFDLHDLYGYERTSSLLRKILCALDETAALGERSGEHGVV